MRPVRLKLKDFLSYRGEHTVEFDGVTLAALIGANGAGKSSLIDAIRFSLFGHTRGGSDGVIAEGEQACRVEFEFALGQDVYLVSRQRSRKGAGSTLLSFQMLTPEGAVVIDGKSVAETQRRIEEALHLTDELFCVTACANQGNVAAFSHAKPAARKQVLSDILDLVAWDRRSEAARQIGREVTAEVTTAREHLARAEQSAREAEATRTALEQVKLSRTRSSDALQQHERAVAEGLSAKERLVREEGEDRARRQELTDLTTRISTTKTSLDEATSRQVQLTKAASGKPLLLDGITKAEAAQTSSQEMEAKRQEDERLAHEAELLEQQRRAKVEKHAQAVQVLRDRIAQTKASHERQTRALQQRITDLTAQAEPLARVPCADTEVAGSCPLIEAARRAKAALPAVEAELAALTGADPTAEDTGKLAELEAKPAGRAERRRLREIASRREEIGYDAAEHARAKAQAGKLRELQEALRRVERAEAQLAEVRPQVERLTAELSQLTGRQVSLQQALGPQRDWAAELTAAERAIKQGRAETARLQSELQSLQQQQGVLEERLRLAERAAGEAERLSLAVRDGDRRLNLLKILAQAYGKSGIPALLIEQAVPDLEAVANDVLSVLSDGRMSLALRSQRETKAKTIQETLDIVIADERGERAYENFSGGEAMRVDLALRIALSVLLASRAGARCEMLVLDETCAPLDAQGRALFVDCLERISDRFATVLVVTHVDELKELFPYRYEISKNGHGSMVNLVAA
ncbi:MAG: AAA family ATPase [Armatimonadota bacterium]